MDVLFEASFAKDLKRIRDKQLRQRIQKVIEASKEANDLGDIQNLKKMQSYDTFYRIRLSDYRIGVEITAEAIIFVRILHLKDIYRRFPKE